MECVGLVKKSKHWKRGGPKADRQQQTLAVGTAQTSLACVRSYFCSWKRLCWSARGPGPGVDELRRDCRLSHLLVLPKSMRKQLLRNDVCETKHVYLMRKAEDKAMQIRCRNVKHNVDNYKGERRRTQRNGKCTHDLRLRREGDFEAAYEHATSMLEKPQFPSLACQEKQKGPCDPLSNARPQPDRWIAAQALAGRHADGKCIEIKTESTSPAVLGNELVELVDSFECIRKAFLKTYHAQLEEALGCGTYSLTPAALSDAVKDAFLASYQARLKQIGAKQIEKVIEPGFHGTVECNYDSIFSRGLLIPNDVSGIQIRNGNAHGNGIYIAKVSDPWLSKSYARGSSKILLCGVVDDMAAPNGSHQSYYRRSGAVHHVGNAMVVFEAGRVAPLFVVDCPSLPPRRPPRPPVGLPFREGFTYLKPWQRDVNARWHAICPACKEWFCWRGGIPSTTKKKEWIRLVRITTSGCGSSCCQRLLAKNRSQ